MHRQEIIGLQYLRGLAALAVVLDHVVVNAAFPKYFGPDPAWMFLRHGRYGVDLFFVISGFIITIVSLDGAGLRPALRLRDFFARRFARIVPLMWLSILSYLALQSLFRHEARMLEYYGNALLLLPGDILPPHIWTLRQELVFYVLFALAMLTVRPARWLLPLWFVACLVQTFDVFGDVFGFRPAADSLAAVVLRPRNLGFGVGMLIAIVWLKRPMLPQWRASLDPLILLAVAFAGAVTVLALLQPLLGRSSVVLAASMLGAVVAYAANLHCPDGPMRRVGELLGAASYSIYLFHSHAVSGGLGILARAAPGTPRGIVVLLVTALAVAVGIAVHLLVEQPLVRLARQWLSGDPAASPIPSSPHAERG